jgi:hypothetical protein
MEFYDLKQMELLTSIKKDTQFNRKGKKLLSYVVDNAPLEMEFNINAGSVFDMDGIFI